MQAQSLQQSIKQLAGSAGMIMQVPALQGKMGGVEYFVITLPYSTATRYITPTDPNLPAQERENRRPTPSRFRDIAKYIRENPEDYRFGAITCTYGKNHTTEPLQWDPVQGSTIGILTLDQRDPLIIVDGQHRFGAIQQALDEDPSLGDEAITVVLFPYTSIRASQQLFSDLNRTAKKTTKSLDILFDHRDVVNRLVQMIVDQVHAFGDRVNREDASVTTNSQQMFTLAGIYQATVPMKKALESAHILDPLTPENEHLFVEHLVDAWEFISSQFPEWGKVVAGQMDIREHRRSFLHWNSGVLSAIGEFVGDVIQEKGEEWEATVQKALTHPGNHGWQRNSKHWNGLATAGTMVLPRSTLRPQLKTYLRCRAGLNLTESDKFILRSFEEELRQSLLASAAHS